MRLELSAPIGCQDGELGKLADVVLDPDSGRVTHLVVQPNAQEALGPRLAPVTLAEARGRRAGLVLNCSAREFEAMDAVRQFGTVPLGESPEEDGQWAVGKVEIATPVMPMPLAAAPMDYPVSSTMAYDRVPKYEIELGRRSPVSSRDGHHLGHVIALTIDDQGLLTGVVFGWRHRWRHRQAEVPVTAIEAMETDLVKLSLTKREARSLPLAPAQT